MLIVVLLLIQASGRSADMSIDVVARTAADHVGEERERATANVQSAVVRADDMTPTDALLRDVPSLHVTHAQNNPLQADVTYRGFSLSPLLGSAQGLAVYVDGVRLNEPFGDTVNWGLLPSIAVERTDLVPGANPAFGLNALGGAIMMRTRSGAAGTRRVDLTAGSFGRMHAAAIGGDSRGRWSSLAAVDHLREEGWRDHSPSRATRGFATLGWWSRRATADVRLAAAATELTGNGPAPVQLLALDRRAVFTHPDSTADDTVLLSSRGTFMRSPQSLIQPTAYVRFSSTRTLNGDDSPFDECDERPGVLCAGDQPVRSVGGDLVAVHDAVNNHGDVRQESGGLAAVAEWTRGRHQLLAGGSVDAGRSRVRLDVELAEFGSDRGTIGSGTHVRNGRVDLASKRVAGAVFISDRYAVTEVVDLTFAARYNRVGVTLDDRIGTDLDGRHRFGHVNASAGVVRSFRRGFTLFSNVSRSTRVPTPVELTCADPEAPCRLPNAFVSDPPLDAVKTTSFELGARGGGRTTWSAAVFHAANHDDILFVSSGRARGEGHFENVGRTIRRGVEIGASSAVWRASYALVDATFGQRFTVASAHHPEADPRGETEVDGGDTIPLSPRHLVKAGATLRLGRARLDVDTRYVSAQFARGDEANLAPPIRASWTTDLRGEFALWSHLTLSVAIDNVFDRRYETFAIFGDPEDVLAPDFDDPRFVSPGAPRTLRAGARLRF